MGKACSKNPFAKMDKRITLQTVTRTADGQGGYTEAWADTATIWASIEPAKGYEKFQAQQLATPITHKITCRYLSAITTAKRLKYGTRIFDIKEVINVNEQDAVLKITAMELA